MFLTMLIHKESQNSTQLQAIADTNKALEF